MKIKTIFIILLTASLTAIIFQNSEQIGMRILWMDFQISKILVLAAVFIIGLIVGLLWAAPKKENKEIETEGTAINEEDKKWLSDEE